MLKQENNILGINVKDNTITLNGRLAYVMDTAIEISESGYTMLPIRYVAQALGANISWNPGNNSILLTVPGT